MVIKTKITEMLGIKHPIIGAPMGPYYTTKMCVAISEAGGLGMLSHTNLFGKSSFDEMKTNMEYVVEHTDKPFGFNIRTARMQPDAKPLCRQVPKMIMENPKIKEQCVYAITSAGSPRMLPESKAFQKLKESGSNIKHFHVGPAPWLVEKCVQAGVDGLVCTGTEGGGHQSYEKISTLVLLQQVKEKYPDFPLVACGGFATGKGLASALALGADAIAMGSRFIATKESEFHDNYKNIIPAARAEDTIIVTGFLGPIRLWKNDYSLHHGVIADKEEKIAEESEMSLEDLIEDQKHYEMIYTGNVKEGAVLLGQSIGIIQSIESCKDVIEKIVTEAEVCLKKGTSYIQ